MTVKIAFRPSLSKTENLTRFLSLGLPIVHSKLVTSKLTASVKLPSNLSETQAFCSCVGYFQEEWFLKELIITWAKSVFMVIVKM